MSTEIKRGEGVELFEKRLTAKRIARVAGAAGSTNVMFDPITIITIIAALLPMIIKCFMPTPVSLRNRDGPFVHRKIAVSIRRESPQTTWQEAYEQADDALAVVDEMTDVELQMVIDDCCK